MKARVEWLTWPIGDVVSLMRPRKMVAESVGEAWCEETERFMKCPWCPTCKRQGMLMLLDNLHSDALDPPGSSPPRRASALAVNQAPPHDHPCGALLRQVLVGRVDLLVACP